MTGPVEHPSWCHPNRCRADELGSHESAPTKVTAGEGAGKAPRIVLVLTSPPNGRPVRIRIIMISDMLVNNLDLDLPAAATLAARLNGLIGQAKQPNGQPPQT